MGELPGQLLGLLTVGVCALAAVLGVAFLRFFYRASGKEQVYKNGIVLTEGGIEYLGLGLTGTRQKAFSEIESVELRSYLQVTGRALLFCYGMNTNKIPLNLFGDILVIGFKRANPFKYLFFTAPKNAAEIYEELQRRIGT